MTFSKSTEYTVKILSLFNEEVEELGLSEISKKLDVYPSKIHRILAPLVQGGIMEQNPETKKYRIGIKALKIGMLYLEHHALMKASLPFMEELTLKFDTVVRLGMLNENSVMIINQIQPAPYPVNLRRVTTNIPLHCSALGKVLLASLPLEAQRAVIYSLNLKKHTERTISEPLRLEREMKQVAKKGYALDIGESYDNLNCVAAPIGNKDRKVVAAISLSHLDTMLPRERCENIASELMNTADIISIKLGYRES